MLKMTEVVGFAVTCLLVSSYVLWGDTTSCAQPGIQPTAGEAVAMYADTQHYKEQLTAIDTLLERTNISDKSRAALLYQKAVITECLHIVTALENNPEARIKRRKACQNL